MSLNSFIFFVSLSTAGSPVEYFSAFYAESEGTEYCQKAASFFVCQSSFPICDCENGRAYMASRQECERISMVECEEEWTSAREYGISLPNCTDLPDQVTSKNHYIHSQKVCTLHGYYTHICSNQTVAGEYI